MKEKFNLKSIIVGLIILLVGIIGIICDLTVFHLPSSWGVSVGCSLIASALVIILTDLLVDRIKENPLESWGIKGIYQTRAKMNDDCSVSMNKAKYQVDVVAFGLKSYRTQQDKLTRKLLQKGVNFRIITMDPSSPFLAQREKEENENEGQIRNTINQLITWADNFNKNNYKGKIVVKGYSCMTLDFYWRVDDDIYFGPYWYSYNSQQTVSYKYSEGKGFELYSDYFEKLWNNTDLTKALTKITTIEKESKKDEVTDA